MRKTTKLFLGFTAGLLLLCGAFAGGADVFDARAILCLLEHALELLRIGDVDHRTAGQRAIERHVFKRHMRAAVKRRGDAGVAADEGDVGVRISGVPSCAIILPSV